MHNILCVIATVKLLSGTKCSYKLTVAVTDIVTNSTTGIGTVKLLSGKKVKLSLRATKVYGREKVWLLPCNQSSDKGQRLTPRPALSI